MVRFWSILVFGVTGWTAPAPASAWSQQPPPPPLLPAEKDRQSLFKKLVGWLGAGCRGTRAC